MPTVDELKAQLKQIQKERSDLEKKIADLQEQERVTMGEHGAGGRLVDSEGFPRADIDVHSARVIRHDLVCAQNDYSALCKKLETALLEMHAQAKAEYDAAHPVPSAP